MSSLKVPAIKCRKCKDIVYSRCRHDMQGCSCGAVAIDGGFSKYCKISGDQEDIEFVKDYEIGNASKQKLYDDWRLRKDKYGKVPDEQTL